MLQKQGLDKQSDAITSSIDAQTKSASTTNQQLAESLRDGFNPYGVKVPARYVLDVKLTADRNDLGIRTDGTASRTQMMVVANFQLKEIATDRTVLQGMTRTAVSFDSLSDEYANVVARQNAQVRSLQDISDDIRTRVLVYVTRHRSTASTQ